MTQQSKISFSGPLAMRLISFGALMRIALSVVLRQVVLRQRLVPSWDVAQEIGVRFWRHQFERALRMGDWPKARAYLDSLQTRTGEAYDVQKRHTDTGHWFTPKRLRSDAVLLYFHGGGYAFDAYMSDEFAGLLSDATGAKLFRLKYRLTPEHPHPAQAQDALAAYREILKQVDPAQLVLTGDSAGGHMVLMALLAAHAHGLPQPALAIGLCPWTDIGPRGQSLQRNDLYDLAPGHSPALYGELLTGGRLAEMREELSPISHDFSGLAPLYLQGGGREVLIDMIREFAQLQAEHGAEICLDVWPDMAHDFFAYGQTLPDSAEALARISEAIEAAMAGKAISPCARTELG